MGSSPSRIPAELRPHVERAMRMVKGPFFFYDLDSLARHLEEMRAFTSREFKLWYACKANPLGAILKLLRNMNFGIDVASLGEMNQVLSNGIKPEHVLATGPAKSRAYLETLLDNGVNIIVCESLNQVKWLSELARGRNERPVVLLRVQLSWSEDSGESVLGGREITPFGLGPEAWKELPPEAHEHLDIAGLHIFQWGNILELAELERIWRETANVASELALDMNFKLRILDLGGGLGVPYHAKDERLPFSKVARLLGHIRREMKLEEIWMELGRYTVAEIGRYFVKVIDRKTVRGRELLVLEGGINHLARPALTGQPFPAEILRESSAPTKTFHLHGPLCTALDKLGLYELPADTDVGDWICFHFAGAYGYTESMPYFLCHDGAGEVVLFNNDVMVPRHPTPARDWLV